MITLYQVVFIAIGLRIWQIERRLQGTMPEFYFCSGEIVPVIFLKFQLRNKIMAQQSKKSTKLLLIAIAILEVALTTFQITGGFK